MRFSSRQSRKTIISLTQTEIMFILATMILVMLLAQKRENLRLQDENQAIMSLPDSAFQADQHSPKSRMSGEVKNVLDSSGSVDSDGTSTRLGSSKDARNGENLPAATEDRKNEPIRQTLDRIGAADLVREDLTEEERLRELIRLASIGKGLEIHNQADVLPEDIKWTETGSSFIDSVPDVSRQTLANKVGFDPCWPKVADGYISYHFTFSTVYDSETDLYRMEPAWDESVLQVRNDLDSVMAVLRRRPEGWITEDEFARFGEEVREQTRTVYRTDCLLVTRINDAGKKAILFIGKYFYPIY